MIDSYRVDENRNINHHGQIRTINSKNNKVFSKLKIKDLLDDANKKEVGDFADDNNLMRDYNLVHREEKKKINAVKDFYENTKFTDENIVKILTLFGKLGTPMIFLTFAGIYWTTGILKYYFV